MFAMGKLCDDTGKHEQAFSCFEQVNHLASVSYEPQVFKDYVTHFINCFSLDKYPLFAQATHQSELPIFIVGIPRSGTTSVEQIIARHPSVYDAGEVDDITIIADNLSRLLECPFPEAGVRATPELIDQIVGAYLARWKRQKPGFMRVTDKATLNF
ncbi:MAG: sulfotransferase [Synechococcaceae cyanobacterium SM2_3_1]|nr:sulfotransferase [Synechococcaceae cyanobacterium SM2_3_1]